MAKAIGGRLDLAAVRLEIISMDEVVSVVITHDGCPDLIDQRLQLHDKTQNATTIFEIAHAQYSVGRGV